MDIPSKPGGQIRVEGTITIGWPDHVGRSVADAQIVGLNWCIVVRSFIHMILLILRIARDHSPPGSGTCQFKRLSNNSSALMPFKCLPWPTEYQIYFAWDTWNPWWLAHETRTFCPSGLRTLDIRDWSFVTSAGSAHVYYTISKTMQSGSMIKCYHDTATPKRPSGHGVNSSRATWNPVQNLIR